MTATHIMLDLETWGKTPGSDIRSIGATVFDPTAGFVGMRCSACAGDYVSMTDCTDCLNTRQDMRGEFYVACENVSKRQVWKGMENPEWVTMTPYPLTRDPETVKWWSDQSPEAQGAFANPIDLKRALERFSGWLNDLTEEPTPADDQNIRLWCNGPNFDEAILAAAYRAVGLSAPWHYRSPRDMRTIVDAAGMSYEEMKEFNHGTAHNALDDAISQAKIVCECYKRLGLQK